MKDYELGIEAFTEAIKIKPDITDARIWMGRDLNLLKRYAEAVPVLQEACRRQPDDSRSALPMRQCAV